MMRGGLEIADVFRDGESQFRDQYGHILRPEQRQVLRAITLIFRRSHLI
jgi:hypothetical protein